MPKFFKKKNKNKPIARKKESIPPQFRVKGEIVDPVDYNGELDEKKYPVLELEADRKIEEEVENPLNKR